MLDREIQRRILQTLAEAFPSYARLRNTQGQKSAERGEIYNLYYLRGHGLVELKSEDLDRVPPARITSAGLDFLADDGGLRTILGIVTVRLHDDTVRALLVKQVQDSDEPEGTKQQLLAVIRGLPAKALETVSLNLISAGISAEGVKGVLHLLTGTPA